MPIELNLKYASFTMPRWQHDQVIKAPPPSPYVHCATHTHQKDWDFGHNVVSTILTFLTPPAGARANLSEGLLRKIGRTKCWHLELLKEKPAVSV